MAKGSHHPYPRTARINQILREVVAEALVRLSDEDERLGLITVTGVETAPDLRTATIYIDSLTEASAEALGELRAELQADVNAQTRMKRTPRLAFAADPAVAAGEKVEEILRRQGHERP
ncbi:MAG TPA: ribosome-binding factor A [Acidimicrobiales bacterium]|nr:ribosome-binding factor A [Acidimicrobiales bacterium]